MKVIKIILFAQFVSLFSIAQTDSVSIYQQKRKKNIVNINVTQALIGDFLFSYERNISKRLSIGTSFGYKDGGASLINYHKLFPKSATYERETSLIIGLLSETINSYYYSQYYKIFITKPHKKGDGYICFEPFTRASWGDQYYDQIIDPSTGLNSVKQKVFTKTFDLGLKILWGVNFKPVKITPGLGMTFNLFWGFSLRYKQGIDKYYKFDRDDYSLDDAKNNNIKFSDETYANDIYSISVLPAFHFGLKMGLGWGKINY